MRPTRLLTRCVLAALLGACGAGDSDHDSDRNDDDGSGGCDLPEYGDGTCQADLACEAPDIDCFVLFETDAAAREWFTKFEKAAAEQEGRPMREFVAEDDPRVVRMRELLDRGWEAYQETNTVGDLANARPGLVVLEDESVNAFVAPDIDNGNAGFTVMVQTGLLDLNGSDAEMLGLVMHELEHAVGLHIVADVRDKLRKFYVAGDEEPFGFQQQDDPIARDAGTAWRELALDVGRFPHAELGGLPVDQGRLEVVLKHVTDPRKMDAACTGPLAALLDLQNELLGLVSRLDDSLTLPADTAARAAAVIADLRDDCLAGETRDVIEVLAEINMVTVEEIKMSLSPEDVALIEGKHVVDGFTAMMAEGRAQMRATEEEFAEATGRPWTALRYYSMEEAADDATVPVLDAGMLPADGLADFLLRVLPEEIRTPCQALLDEDKTPPYGADLQDEHHAVCWRVDHVQRVAESGVLTDPDDDEYPEYGGTTYLRTATTPDAPRRRIPLPTRYRDLIVY